MNKYIHTNLVIVQCIIQWIVLYEVLLILSIVV